MKISELTTLLAIVPLLLAPLPRVATAQQCPVTREAVTYPMISNRYAVQYKLDRGDWTDAQVRISYYGGTTASPYLTYAHYPPDTSMSFASIPASAGTAVALRITKLSGSNF